MATLTSDKDFKTKGTSSPKGHNNPELYAPNNRVSKCVIQTGRTKRGKLIIQLKKGNRLS